jgi:hypothetical protein
MYDNELCLPPSIVGVEMPKGPKGERRPADVIGAAIMAAKIATGELEEKMMRESAAVELGRKGGRERAKKMTPERRKEIARTAAAKRWAKK